MQLRHFIGKCDGVDTLGKERTSFRSSLWLFTEDLEVSLHHVACNAMLASQEGEGDSRNRSVAVAVNVRVPTTLPDAERIVSHSIDTSNLASFSFDLLRLELPPERPVSSLFVRLPLQLCTQPGARWHTRLAALLSVCVQVTRRMQRHNLSLARTSQTAESSVSLCLLATLETASRITSDPQLAWQVAAHFASPDSHDAEMQVVAVRCARQTAQCLKSEFRGESQLELHWRSCKHADVADFAILTLSAEMLELRSLRFN
ncbi:MAG: hypothetical protein MHM6MM_003021 [Cercozoa sp. M6MM]